MTSFSLFPSSLLEHNHMYVFGLWGFYSLIGLYSFLLFLYVANE